MRVTRETGDVAAALAAWKRYALWDATLHDLFERFPLHDDAAQVAAKVFLLGRSYATGIERHVRQTRTAKGMDVVVDALLGAGEAVDDLIRPLRHSDEVPARESMPEIARAHYKLTRILARVTRGTTPRSFAAKYLHFHASGVPIYDSIAQSTITSKDLWRYWIGRPTVGSLDVPPRGVDEAYWAYCQRLILLAEAWREQGVDSLPTARNLDIYLLAGRWNKSRSG